MALHLKLALFVALVTAPVVAYSDGLVPLTITTQDSAPGLVQKRDVRCNFDTSLRIMAGSEITGPVTIAGAIILAEGMTLKGPASISVCDGVVTLRGTP